jgi:pilus assembly protein CpaE
MIRVLIADESRQITDNISRRLALEDDLEVCGTAGDGEAAVQQAVWLKPDIAVIDAGLPGMDGGQTTQMLAQAVPATGVIMMSMEAHDDAYRQAMLAGVREFLQKPFKGDDLVDAVRRVHSFRQRRAAGASLPQAPVSVAPSPVVRATTTAAPRVHTRGVVTAVISGKGGVGRTVVAINIAAALGEKHPGQVVLVDLSLQYGDVGAALNLPTANSITDLLPENGTADSEVVRQVLTAGPGGTRVLLAPISPELADSISVAHVTSLIETLQREFDFIVIDTPSALNEVSLHTLELADHLVMLTDLSVTGIKNARLTRGVLETLGVDPTRVLVVANHREGSGELDRRGAETFLGARISVEIPFAPEIVAMSVNKAVPFVISSPSAAPSAAVRIVVATIDPVSQSGGDTAPNPAIADPQKKPRRKLSFTR